MSDATTQQVGDMPIAQQIDKPQPQQRHCPVCSALVQTRIVYGALMLDYHLSAKYYRTWCSGSDYNLSDAEEA